MPGAFFLSKVVVITQFSKNLRQFVSPFHLHRQYHSIILNLDFKIRRNRFSSYGIRTDFINHIMCTTYTEFSFWKWCTCVVLPQASFSFILFARKLLHGVSPSPTVVFNWILLARYLMRRASSQGRLRWRKNEVHNFNYKKRHLFCTQLPIFILVQRKSFTDCFYIFRLQRTFKIVVLGDAGTGKSSLITRFVDGTFASRRLELVAVRCDSNVATWKRIFFGCKKSI